MNERIALTISAIVLAEPLALGLWRALCWLWRLLDALADDHETDRERWGC